MLLHVHIAQDQTPLVLAPTPFAKGGEGSLYKVQKPAQYRNHVAKIYHKNKRNKQRHEKIRYLIAHPPQFDHSAQAKLVVWPKHVLLHRGQFVGFLMPLAEGNTLEILCTPNLPKRLAAGWKALEFGQPQALQKRVQICFNLAVALYHLHATGHYALVDLKPDNILIKPNGLVSIVDMDSVEVLEGNKVLFPAPVATPEFTPPEFYGIQDQRQTPILETWDRFAMAVIFYKILLGIHPFAGTGKGDYEQFTTLADKIEQGLFVHHPQQADFFRVIPNLHQRFRQLPERIQYLFEQCFVGGLKHPNLRPSAEDWCIALSDGHRVELLTHYALLSNLENFKPKHWVKQAPQSPDWVKPSIFDWAATQKLMPQIANTRFLFVLLFVLAFGAWLFWQHRIFLVLLVAVFLLGFALISYQRKKVLAFWQNAPEQQRSLVSQENISDKQTVFYQLARLSPNYEQAVELINNALNDLHESVLMPLSYDHYIRQQDKKIVQLAKAERQAKQRLNEQLAKDKNWQQFWGKTLDQKLQSLPQYYEQQVAIPLRKVLKTKHQQLDKHYTQLAEKRTQAYHQELTKIDQKAKQAQQKAQKSYAENLQKKGSQATSYRSVQADWQGAQRRYQTEVNSLYEELQQAISDLEYQQHKNLRQLALTEGDQNKLASAEQKAQQLIEMTQKSIRTLKKRYQIRKQEISEKWLKTVDALDKERQKVMKDFVQENWQKQTLDLEIQGVERQKRQAKILAEIRFIRERQGLIQTLKREKQAVDQEFNQRLAAMQKQMRSAKAHLKALDKQHKEQKLALKTTFAQRYEQLVAQTTDFLKAQKSSFEENEAALAQATKQEKEQFLILLQKSLKTV